MDSVVPANKDKEPADIDPRRCAKNTWGGNAHIYTVMGVCVHCGFDPAKELEVERLVGETFEL